jgi:hypothetical protein
VIQGIVQYIHPLPQKENGHVTPHLPEQGEGLTLEAEVNHQSAIIVQERIPDPHLQNHLDGILGATVSLVVKQKRNRHHVLPLIVVMNRGPQAEVSHQVEVIKQTKEHLHHQNMDVDSLTIRKGLNHLLPQVGETIMNVNEVVKAGVLAAVVQIQV